MIRFYFIMSRDDNFINLPPKKTIFKICKCGKEIYSKSRYYEHLKKCPIAESRTSSGNSIISEDDNLPPKKNFFKICKCEKEFYSKSWYYTHLKNCPIAESRTPSGNFTRFEKDNFVNVSQKKTFLKICKCEKEFNSRRLYYRHLKSCPIAKKKTPSANFICKEENCSFRTRLSDGFLQHLKDIHHKKPFEDVKVFQNYSDFKTWLQNFEKEERSSFLRSSITSSESKKIEYYYCNRSGKYFSKSTGKRCLKKGSRKMGFNCPASIKAIVETESSLVTVIIKSLHYGHNLDLCHINLPKNERIEIANQLLQGIKPKEVLKNICDTSSTKLERKHLCTKKDLWNIIKSYRINNVKKHVEDYVSVDICVEEVVAACMSVNDVEVKDELLLKISQIQELIETCNNQDLLLASEQHINNALIVLNSSN